ncbi:hypothetical protein BH24ACI3_BH24ACI3_01000 [soil metagenome]
MPNTKELTLPSKIESVDEAAVTAESFARQNGMPDDVISAIDLAVRESVANAVKHGNKLDAEKSVEITLTTSESIFEIAVRDHGSGFALTEIPDPTDPANLLKASGRGILFMRSFMDTVEWTEHPQGGMVVSMTKHF